MTKTERLMERIRELEEEVATLEELRSATSDSRERWVDIAFEERARADKAEERLLELTGTPPKMPVFPPRLEQEVMCLTCGEKWSVRHTNGKTMECEKCGSRRVSHAGRTR